ncbi:hypothetical protein [Actinotalea solisilvae]|uniref:hypothetical protein n=1 Tax=Actinotalea solisilvae TaxID=2072922 RepID=UPI0018F14826|nr:hypothetical protein [Actinotalea solisilvae]
MAGRGARDDRLQDPDDAGGAGRDDGRRPAGRGRQALRVVVAFVTGVLLTAAAGLVLTSFGVIGAGRAPEADPTSTPTPAQASGDVPAPCVQAAEYNATLTAALDEVALGLRDQDARRAAEALDAVQDARPGSEQASRECRELAGQDVAAADQDGSEPTDEPSEEPTDGPTEEADEPSESPSAEPRSTPTATP